MDRIRASSSGIISSLDWFDRAYVVDWIATGLLLLVSKLIGNVPVFERPIPLNDPSISFAHRGQQVPGALSDLLTYWTPLGLAVLNGLVQRSSLELHHGCLAFLSGRFLMETVVDFIKNRVGRLRPDFLDRCQWDAILGECTGEASLVKEGRRSFPSGHSSAAFTGFGFIALLLATKLLAPPSGTGFLASRILRLCVVLAPLLVATWIAITRLEDYWHHVEDVLAGSLLGSVCILVTYHIYWPSPFRSYSSVPRMVYGQADALKRGEGYGLARVELHEDDEERV